MGRSCRSDSPELKLEMATDTGLDCQSDRLEKPGLRPIWRWVQFRREPVSLLFGQYQGDFRKKQRTGGRKFRKALQHVHFSNIAPIRYQGETGSAQFLQH